MPEFILVIVLLMVALTTNIQIWADVNFFYGNATVDQARYRMTLFTAIVLNYTEFRTTVIVMPIMTLVPYYLHTLKYAEQVYDQTTGEKLNEAE
jgi:hypothetical protein